MCDYDLLRGGISPISPLILEDNEEYNGDYANVHQPTEQDIQYFQEKLKALQGTTPPLGRTKEGQAIRQFMKRQEYTQRTSALQQEKDLIEQMQTITFMNRQLNYTSCASCKKQFNKARASSTVNCDDCTLKFVQQSVYMIWLANFYPKFPSFFDFYDQHFILLDKEIKI